MENSSETPRRGRPKVLHDEVELGLMRDGQGRRSHLNFHWFLRAIGVLTKNDEPAFRWLFEEGTGESKKKTLIAELGRILETEGLGERAMLEVARQVCERRPTTREGVALMRRWRTGRTREGSTFDLEMAILKAIAGYVAGHETTDEQVLAALGAAAEAWRDAGEGEGDED
jgi:hypothetical protein